MTAVKSLKAKLVKLYSTRLSRGTAEKHTKYMFQEEWMPLFHLIKRRTKREQRTITNVQDPVSGTQTSTKGIVDAFNSFLRRKYGPVPVDEYQAYGGGGSPTFVGLDGGSGHAHYVGRPTRWGE